MVYKLSTWQAFVCDAKLQIPKFGWGAKGKISIFSHHFLGLKVILPLEFYLFLSFFPLSFAVRHRIVKLFKYKWVIEQDL